MRSFLVVCVLLDVLLSVWTASVPPPTETVTTTTTVTPPVTGLYNDTTTPTTPPTTTPTTTPTTILTTTPTTVTGLYNDVTITPTTTPTTETGIFDTFTTLTTTSTTQTTTPTTPYTTPVIPITTTTCCATSPSLTTTPNHYIHTSPSQSQMMCPEGWELFQGRCYSFVIGGMTWPQAQSNCDTLDATLVSVHSTQEYGFLQQLTKNNNNQNAWLGGFYLQNQWLWLDGSWFYNNSWSNEYPDSTSPCLLLNSDDAWSNSPCNTDGFPSICVKNSNVPQRMVCPQGWTGFEGRCYYHNYESLTWSGADNYCAGLEASLVSVHSPREYYFLYQQSTVNGFSPTWLGGFYLEGQWMWLDGSWFYEGFFTQMSPNSTNPCLTIYSSEGWSNYDCNQQFPSFCVKNEIV